MRFSSIGHGFFAVSMIGLGIVGLLHPDWVPLWNPIPAWFPAHLALIYLAGAVSIGSGIGLIFPFAAAGAARLLLATFVLWLIVLRVPEFFRGSVFGACWGDFPMALMLAADWVLLVELVGRGEARKPGIIIGRRGLRGAQLLYGLCMIFFGLAHFIDVKDTLSLIPAWLPGHYFWAYFFGCTFIAAGLAGVLGIFARVAVALSAVQIGLFLVLVWIPIVVKGAMGTFAWSETILNAVLLAGAWVVGESYCRGAKPA